MEVGRYWRTGRFANEIEGNWRASRCVAKITTPLAFPRASERGEARADRLVDISTLQEERGEGKQSAHRYVTYIHDLTRRRVLSTVASSASQ